MPVKKLELKKKAKKPMISITNAHNSALRMSQKGKKKNEIKKATSSKAQIIQPEDKNSGRKLTSQSTQSLTMLSPISTSLAQISFTPQWHPVHNIQYNETQPTPSLMPGSFSSMINLFSTQPMPFMMQYQNIPTTNLNTLNNNH